MQNRKAFCEGFIILIMVVGTITAIMFLWQTNTKASEEADAIDRQTRADTFRSMESQNRQDVQSAIRGMNDAADSVTR